MTINLYDPTLKYQRQPPNSTGTVVSVSGYNAVVRFRERSIPCKVAGKNTLVAGDTVSVIFTGGYNWCVKTDSGLTSLWQDDLKNWQSDANVFLRYVMDGNPKRHFYKTGFAVAAVSASVLRVSCWDGVTRDLPVEYNSVAKAASVFSAGDEVLLHNRAPLAEFYDFVVVGKAAILAILTDFDSFDFGGVIVDQTSQTEIAVTGQNLVDAISASTASPFTVSADGIAWSSSATLPKEGGTLYVKFSPATEEAFNQNVTLTSAGAENKTVAMSGTGIAAPAVKVQMKVVRNGLWPFGGSGWSRALDGGITGSDEVLIYNETAIPALSVAQKYYLKIYRTTPPQLIPEIVDNAVSFYAYDVIGDGIKITVAFRRYSDGSLISSTDYFPTQTPTTISQSTTLPLANPPTVPETEAGYYEITIAEA